MGLTHVTATVMPLEGKGSPVTDTFLVDTGAIDCLLPASALHRAGIEPQRADFYELADGQLIEFPVGVARIEFMGSLAIAKVIFGPEGSEPILGAMALEYAGFTVDPSSQTLKRLAARSLKPARDRVPASTPATDL
ncbi:MAG TPA: aspartyl protease family protein [Steroidobacteraceae bacterium]